MEYICIYNEKYRIIGNLHINYMLPVFISWVQGLSNSIFENILCLFFIMSNKKKWKPLL
jgi:hypothetical protein